MSKRAIILGLIAILFWSTAATAFKLALKELHYVQVLLVASVVSFIALTVIVIVKGKYKDLFNRKCMLNGIVSGLLNPFGYYLVLFKAYTLIPAQVAQPLNFIWPIMLVLLSAIVFKEKIGVKSIIALLISFSGVFIISSQGSFGSLAGANLLGVLLAVGSSLIWASYWIWNMKHDGNELIKLFYGFLYGAVFITIVYLFLDMESSWSFKGVAYSVYIGLFEMGITFALWLTALTIAGTAKQLGNLVYLVPFLSLVFIWIVLKEKIMYTTYIGLVVIISGIILQRYKLKGE